MKTLQERCIRTLFFFSETPAVLIKKIGLLVEPQWRWPFVDVGASENNATAKFFAAKNAVQRFPTLCLFLFFGSLFGQRKTSANDGCKGRCGARSCSVMTSAYCLPAVFYMASAFAFCFCFCIFIFLSSFAFVRVCINSSLQPNSPSSSPATPPPHTPTPHHRHHQRRVSSGLPHHSHWKKLQNKKRISACGCHAGNPFMPNKKSFFVAAH